MKAHHGKYSFAFSIHSDIRTKLNDKDVPVFPQACIYAF